jgi:hypothetical protein
MQQAITMESPDDNTLSSDYPHLCQPDDSNIFIQRLSRQPSELWNLGTVEGMCFRVETSSARVWVVVPLRIWVLP